MPKGDTKQKLLDAARELMLSRGYSATSVDEICSRAGVSKGSFYHFFPTKEELGLAVLNAFYHDGVGRVRRGEYARIADPTDRLLGLLDHLETIAPDLWEHGCLMGNFATELCESNPVIGKRVDEVFTELTAGLSPLFAPIAADPGEAMELAEQLLMVIEGSIIFARAHRDPKRIADGVRRFRGAVQDRIQRQSPSIST